MADNDLSIETSGTETTSTNTETTTTEVDKKVETPVDGGNDNLGIVTDEVEIPASRKKFLKKDSKEFDIDKLFESYENLEKKLSEKPKLNVDELVKKSLDVLVKENKLTDDVTKDLESVGLSPSLIADLKELYDTRRTTKATETLSKAGLDAASYKDLIAWAKSSLSAAEIAEFNEAVASPSQFARVAAIKELIHTRNSKGYAPRKEVVGGAGTGNAKTSSTPKDTTSVYKSRAEAGVDMGSVRYSQDPEFRAEVDAKYLRSGLKKK